MTTYVNEQTQNCIINGINIDLAVKRQHLIYQGYQLKKVDIYGRGWPDSIRISESRYNDRQETKLKILKQYQYNICMENTSFPYYCSEKIWESIKAYCIPIYSSFNTKIYEDFPKNSFIDYDDFKNDNELYSYIENMSKDEYINRLNLCIDVFNKAYHNINFVLEKQKSLAAIASRITDIINLHNIL